MMTKQCLPMAWLVTLGLVLTGCGSSPPNNYYLLSAHEFPAPQGEKPALGVGPIDIPDYLSRSNLVYKREANKLQVASTDLWAEPLVNGIQRVLVLNLAGQLNTQNVISFPSNTSQTPDYAVSVNLLQLDTDGKEAMLTAEWRVNRPTSSASVKRRISRLQLSLSPGATEPEQVAATYSELLFQLSEIIAAAIAADQASRTSTP